MRKRLVSVLIASALCAASGPALAQPAAKSAPATTVAPVTVNPLPPPKVIEQHSRGFVQGHAAVQNPEVDQIGRWRDPVCVEVVGLPQDGQAGMIKARVESVARAVGLPAARKACRPNVEIVFSDRPQQVMDLVAERREYLLGYTHRHERDRLKTVTHPIQAWYVTATKGTGSGDGALVFSGLAQLAQTETDVIDDPINIPPGGCAGSHFTACLQSEFRNVFVVADSKALDGRELGLVADYVVMLALSAPRSLDRCNVLPSVMDLFARPACAGRDPPDGLTPADAAYLTALYAADGQAKRATQQGEIASRMARILTRASAAGGR